MSKFVFEPHNLHGQTIDGEEMPFGYISAIQESGNRLPVFELSTLFGPMPGFDRPALAQSMAEAPALTRIAEELGYGETSGRRMNEIMQECRDILSRIDAARLAPSSTPSPTGELVTVSADHLAALVGAAGKYADDLETGLEDGTYEDRADLDAVRAALAVVQGEN